MRVLLCVLVLGLAAPAVGQPTTTTITTTLVPDLEWPTALYVGAAGADWAVSGVCFVQSCAANGHPALFRVEDPRVNVPVGLAIDASVIAFTRLYLGRRHPVMTAAILYGLTAFRVVYLTHKVADLRRNGR